MIDWPAVIWTVIIIAAALVAAAILVWAAVVFVVLGIMRRTSRDVFGAGSDWHRYRGRRG